MKNKNIKKIALTLILSSAFVIRIGTNYTINALVNEKDDSYYTMPLLQSFNDDEGIGKCDCGISFKQHKETFEEQYSTAFAEKNTNNLLCDCGEVLSEKVAFVGEFIYSESNDCKHNKQGVDYLYKQKTVKGYNCEKCENYFEVDIFDNELECKGL